VFQALNVDVNLKIVDDGFAKVVVFEVSFGFDKRVYFVLMQLAMFYGGNI